MISVAISHFPDEKGVSDEKALGGGGGGGGGGRLLQSSKASRDLPL